MKETPQDFIAVYGKEEGKKKFLGLINRERTNETLLLSHACIPSVVSPLLFELHPQYSD